ncbi:MAG TPA: penicillin-binding transpeptidase domain-containing protein [Dongiaceae bacterium]|jgi:penicillin-binding protein 2|nr:penicillin-binding transpeptidase domain-containing protein [Dongiaceae bacterium]
MLIFDQLKKNDPALRLVALAVLVALSLLLVGLWWVQVVRGRYYQAKLVDQSYRTVRVPAPRGMILDRNRKPLAENRPSYNLGLYLEELSPNFQQQFSDWLSAYKQAKIPLRREQREELGRRARYAVASNLVAQVSGLFQTPLNLDYDDFERHYAQERAFPLMVCSDLNRDQIARVEEHADLPAGLDLDIQPTRYYPQGGTTVHVLGYVRLDNSSVSNEEAYYDHRLPDFRGIVGVEAAFDPQLRGSAGEKAELVDNLGYRQQESMINPVEPGMNLVLTLDLDIQKAAENALLRAEAQTRGAAVVMDVRNGDILAMASAPTFDPNKFVQGVTPQEWAQLNDERLRPMFNRCMQENYPPGSIFKPIVALAALENGMNPKEEYQVEADPRDKAHGWYSKDGITKRDTAPPGMYDFKKALIHSSNAYFINCGLHCGMRNIVRVGQKFHLGESVGLEDTRQQVKGYFPDLKRVSSGWSDGNTANACIGQSPILVTPLQMAVVTMAIANGGKVYWPRLLAQMEPQDPTLGEATVVYPAARLRDELGVSRRSLDILRTAMLDDTENAEGTAYRAFRSYYELPGSDRLRVCGKTGTAQVQNERNITTDHITWFISFAPYENPRYAVVVMVESGSSGGGTCAPVACDIYRSILSLEQAGPARNTTLARAE